MIRNILDRSLLELHSVEVVQVNASTPFLPPSNLLIPDTHPRANVDFAVAGKERKYRCSVCGSKDHTAPSVQSRLPLRECL